MMRRQLILILFFCSLGGAAQAPRDYAISLPSVSYAPAGASAEIRFTVSNQGGAAAEATQIVISDDRSGRIAVQAALPPLAAGESRDFRLELPLDELPAEALSFTIEAGVDQYELAGSPISRNNIQAILINSARAGLERPAGPPAAAAEPEYDFFLPLLNIGINFRDGGIEVNGAFYSPAALLLRLVGLLLALFCLWLLSLALRLIFRRPPKFEPWQPPYALNSWQDPDSTAGRRQNWQYHAQNSRISAARAPDQVTVIKRLTDREGTVLGAWSFVAMRTVQYDIYGRISRSEVVMPRSLLRALNRVIRRASQLDSAELNRALTPIAKRLSRRALSGVEKQNASLWLALEMRLEGQAEAARVLFELYQYRSDAWHRIDQWQPELAATGARLPEQFSYTLNGQLPGETYREFKRRLAADIASLLADMLSPQQAANEEAPREATETNEPAPALDDETAIP